MYTKDSALLPRWAALLMALAILLTLAVPTASADDIANTQRFRKYVTLEGIRQHQQALQNIAGANGGNRVSGSPRYDASAQYVYDRMVAKGYNVSFQEFTFLFVGDLTPPVFQQVSPIAKSYVNGVDFRTMDYSGSGDVTAPLVAVDLVVPSLAPNTSTSGCEARDFARFPAGSIALMQLGTCTFRLKAENALAAGAVGAIIFNEGNPDRTGAILGRLSPPPVALPTAGATFILGDELRNGVLNGPTGVTVRLRTDVIAENRTTRNVIAETPTGDPNRVVVIGAHLDSVTGGPGINDNGSGSATILEIAEVFADQERDHRNQVRFLWFGAEEFGLIGSDFYVNSLPQAEREKILLMLNIDMVGSPNFVRFVYDGDGSAFPPVAGLTPPPGSDLIERVFLDYFASQGLATDPTPLDGRSDHGPFIAAGIPAGGLFTGAKGLKTAAQAAVYGGAAGQPYDPCYHLACDTLANISNTALDQMSDAVAHAIVHFAEYKGDLPPTPRGRPSSFARPNLDRQGPPQEQ